MPISKEDYIAATNVIVEKDKELAQTTKDIIDSMSECIENAIASLNTLREDVPTNSNIQGSARGVVESLFSQTNSLKGQTVYMLATLNAVLNPPSSTVLVPGQYPTS